MAKKKQEPIFTKVAPNEVKIEYKGNKFVLIEDKRGVYGLGRAIQLYQLKDFDKTHLKEVGWTSSDNHSCSGKENALITTMTNMEECKVAAIKYIDVMS